MRENDTVAVYFVRTMLHALRAQPERAAALLAEAGIDQAVLESSVARVPAPAFARLWLLLILSLIHI